MLGSRHVVAVAVVVGGGGGGGVSTTTTELGSCAFDDGETWSVDAVVVVVVAESGG